MNEHIALGKQVRNPGDVVADQLGLKPEEIKVNLDFDTAKDAWSIATGNYSSRFSSATAVAAQMAAKKVRASRRPRHSAS